MLCARCFLQDVRFDRNRKRLAGGVRVHEEGQDGKGAAATGPRTGTSVVRSGAGMISSLSVGSTKPRDPLNPRTDYREEMRAELLSSFSVGMTKLTNTRAICHKMGFNASLLQHDSTAKTGTGVQLPALASHEE